MPNVSTACLRRARRALEQEAELDQDERREVHPFSEPDRAPRLLEERGIVVTADVLREAVRRDIEALFNTERLEAPSS